MTADTGQSGTESKECKKCGVDKPLDQYGWARQYRKGSCKECEKVYRADHYQKNKEHTKAVNKAWLEKNYDHARTKQKEWLAANKEHHSEYGKRWYKSNKDQHRANGKEWYSENKESVATRAKLWRLENKEKAQESVRKHAAKYPERRKASARAWAKRNPHIVREQAMRRQAAKLRATPPWLTAEHKAQILEYYEIACWLTANDTPCHVDHIEPLRGKDRCGLHVPWNLQILTATENLKKGNRTS